MREPAGTSNWQLLGELGGSHIRRLFASTWTLTDWDACCNRIAKLLKRLIIIPRIVYQPRSSRAGLHANARRRNQIEIYFSIVHRNPTVQPTARRSSSENNSCARSGRDTPFWELDKARPRRW